MEIWKVPQNVENGVVWGGYGSPKVIEIAPVSIDRTQVPISFP